MKTIFFVIAFAVILIYLSKPNLEFKPFKVSFESPYLAIGVLFLGIGMGCIQHQSNKEGYARGVKDTIKAVRQWIDEKNS